MPQVKLPDIDVPQGDPRAQILHLQDVLHQYKKTLEYTLQNLDSSNISGFDAVGSAIQTSKSGKRIEINGDGNSVNIFNASGDLVGQIDWDDNGAGAEDDPTERIYVRSLGGTAIKIASEGGDVIIEGANVWFTGTVHGVTAVFG